VKVKYVTTVPLRHPVPQFDVSFLEKLLKIVAILGYIFLPYIYQIAFGGLNGKIVKHCYSLTTLEHSSVKADPV